MHTLKCAAAALAAGLALVQFAPPAQAQFNVNDAFIANETPEPGAETLTFAGPAGGTISLGHNLTPNTPGTLSTANLVHTDAFNGNANLEGFFVQNSALVPAYLVNTTAALLVTNFGSTLGPEQILLHPGNPGPDAFAQPASAAVLRYTVPTTGQYNITGDFESLAGGTVAVDILVNGTSILTAGAGTDATAFAEVENLNAGDLLDFVVDDAGDIGSDSTGLRANITLVPEPAALGVLALGGLAVSGRRRRRRGA